MIEHYIRLHKITIDRNTFLLVITHECSRRAAVIQLKNTNEKTLIELERGGILLHDLINTIQKLYENGTCLLSRVFAWFRAISTKQMPGGRHITVRIVGSILFVNTVLMIY